jgi:hypothetical protein
MAVAASELELESAPEFESEWEWESELEYEGELEAENEEFFRTLAATWQSLRTPGTRQRRVALDAARNVLRTGLGGAGNVLGTRLGGQWGGVAGSSLGQGLGSALGGLLPDTEFESEWEFEGEMNPLRRVYPDALMEHLGHAAAETESEAEAEALIGALVPLAARVIPRVAPAIMRTAPSLIRGLTGVARTLRRNPTTRPLVRAVPTIVRRTAASLARQSARGRPVTQGGAVRTLANQTARVLASPPACVAAYRRSRALDRRFHQAAAVPTLQPARTTGGRC